MKINAKSMSTAGNVMEYNSYTYIIHLFIGIYAMNIIFDFDRLIDKVD